MKDWGKQIQGRHILEQVKESYKPFIRELEARNKQIAIIRFLAEENATEFDKARYEAAHISTRQKVKIFNFLKCHTREIVLNPNLSKKEFYNTINTLNINENVTGIIVQLPIPERLRSILKNINPQKDLDVLSGKHPTLPCCATAEAIIRIAEPFMQSATVAVVGAKGFVGSGVVKLLNQNKIKNIALDLGDDITQTLEADIVISATGQPEILDRKHIAPYHRLVIDSGFLPHAGEIYGDLNKSAYEIPQNLTPVPGGIGPVEMAILMERILIKEITNDLQPWQYRGETYLTKAEVETNQKQWANLIYPIVRRLFDFTSSTSPQLIDRQPDIEILKEQNYIIKLQKSNVSQTFHLEKSDRGELLKVDLLSNIMTSTTGLTAKDLSNWQQIQQQLDSPPSMKKKQLEL